MSEARAGLSGTARHVTVSAPGKVNLSLRVGPPGADGYHPVATVYLAVSLRETVTAIARTDGHVTVGPCPRQVSLVDAHDVPWDERNLAHRAAVHLRTALGLDEATHGVHLDVAKQVPVAGGMGGGSADAADAMLACSVLWETGHTRSELAELAAPLGADVPFAVLGGAAVGLGTGAELTPVAARTPVHLVLVPADAGLSTPVVFGTLDELRRDGHVPEGPAHPEVNQEVVRALTAADPLALATAMDNDLQTPAVALFPDLGDVLDLGLDEGALRGMVSGSGPTLLFVVPDEHSALSLATAVEERTGVRALPVHGPVAGAHVL